MIRIAHETQLKDFNPADCNHYQRLANRCGPRDRRVAQVRQENNSALPIGTLIEATRQGWTLTVELLLEVDLRSRGGRDCQEEQSSELDRERHCRGGSCRSVSTNWLGVPPSLD